MRQLTITQSITARDSGSLDKYLAEISKCEMITAAEEVVLAVKIRSGDQMALEKLVLANLRFVVSVAKQYQNYGMRLTDLINEGNLGLIKAAQRFDETRGFKFISYAVWWIRQSIIQAIGENSRMVRLPVNKLGILSKIKKGGAILEQKLERDASAQEIAEEIQMTEEQVKSAMSVEGKHLSTDASIGGDSDEWSLIDVLVNPDSEQPDNKLINSSLHLEIKRALASLTDREKDIISLFYGIGFIHGLSLQEIGEKYDLSRERVRQIKEKAIRKLRYSRSKLLRSYL